MANPIFILDITAEGIVATHPANVELPVLLAPTPEEQKATHFNTIRPSLMTLGCMNLSDQGFAFDSSFIAPGAKSRFVAFAELMSRLKDDDPQKGSRVAQFPPINIFGHTDPTGDDDYNKELGGRRARAVYGMLTRDLVLWEFLFSHPFGGDDWGQKSIQLMLQTLGGPIPFYLGPIDGAITPETKQQTHDAIEAYQRARNIEPVTGTAGAVTRKVMFAEYMDEICQFKNKFPFKLDQKSDFVCHAEDSGRKGDIMGCGEFNPIFLASKEEQKRFDTLKAKPDPELQDERDTTYAVDRRVLVFIYKHDTDLDPTKWPCPRAREGAAGCRERFWSDHKKRLEFGEKRRRFKKTGDTFACRWYHGIAQYSPCEAGVKLWVLQLRVDGPANKPEPFKNRNYVVIAGEEAYSPVLRGATDDNGQIVIPVLDEPVQMTLKLDLFADFRKPGDPKQSPLAGEKDGFDIDRFSNEEDFVEFKLDCGQLKQMTQDDLPAQQRLYNLGFGTSRPGTMSQVEFRNAVKGFQRSQGLPKDKVTGQLDDNTRAALKKEHEGP